MNKLSRLLALAVVLALFVSGCGPKAPSENLILWEQPSPLLAALAHVKERPGLKAYTIAPTGSMEPFLTAGDVIVVDTTFPYDKLQPADLLNYQANWRPADSLTVTHMAGAKSGDDWIMDGIHNENYEKGSQRMTRSDYRGKVIQVYTKRKKS